tara:strand:- start:843 stop:2141 length:1299 start_codon:yes stop_codon:yes gene_type:complete
LEKFKKLNHPIEYIALLVFLYFFIPGSLKYSKYDVLFRYEEIFFASGILILCFQTYKKLNNDQKKLFIISNSIAIYIYLINIFYFYLTDNLKNEYLIWSLFNGYIYFFGLLNLFLIIFFFNNKTELFLLVIYLTGIFISFEFIFFIFLSDYFSISEIIYNNSYFEFKGEKYLLFRSIFFGDHITTSVWAFASLFAGFVKKNKSFFDYIIFGVLISITFFNFESKLNILNALFCVGVFIYTKLFNIKINLKTLFYIILFYIFLTISTSLILNYYFPNIINLNSFADRVVLNIFNLDTYLGVPWSLGFDNLKHFYIYNENILLKKLIYFMSLGGNGVGTISSLGSDFYFYLWNTITSPHNILMTYFSTLGFWLIPIIIFFNRFSKKNFFYKKILLIILLNLIIFSFWNQIWHIDLLFVLIISLIMNEGLKSETK